MPDDVAYFHAQYRQAKPVEYKKEYVILDGVRGKGHYVGTTLNVNLNCACGWWGDGEIKFYLDGDDELQSAAPVRDYFSGAFSWDVNGKYNTLRPVYGMFNVVQPDGL